MHLLFWGTYDTGKPRVRLLIEGLRAHGTQVDECHADVWGGVLDKSQLHGARQRITIALRWLGTYPNLLWRLLRAPKPQAIVVSYPGLLDIILAAPVARLRGIPIVWDMFMSVYDTVVEDRALLSAGSWVARALRWVEGFALRRADLVFLDTQAHARRVESLFCLPHGELGAVWVGAETEHFHVQAAERAVPRAEEAPLRVLFYGQFIPLHGIATIIEAAQITKDLPVEWILIGRGQEAEKIRRLLAEKPLPKLRWIDWVNYEKLQCRISDADVCLGIFGNSQKAASVIPNKVFQIVAAGRPLITRDSLAVRELLKHRPGFIYLVQPANPLELANAVREHLISSDWRNGISCHQEMVTMINHTAIGKQFIEMLRHSKLCEQGK